MANVLWHSVSQLTPETFACGFCNFKVASDRGYFPQSPIDGYQSRILICPNCSKPTFFNGPNVTPGAAPGNRVENVPSELHDLYDEARRSMSVNSFTATVLVCRKMLMNIAVAQGTEAGLTFVKYVEFLASNHFVPPNGKGWVDHIRSKGNEATHEIALMTSDDAGELISFVEMLLKFIYEFPAKVPASK